MQTIDTMKILFADAAKDLKKELDLNNAMQSAGIISYRFLPIHRQAFLEYCKNAWFYDDSYIGSLGIEFDPTIHVDSCQINPGQVLPKL